ncbi:hypothetical protein PALS2_084 [Staphylococcus phage PALS_2]|nr:hypothetical protein PALS2_084 [Staphylococcus phage PALS_2]UAJ17101.1 hypothetical protein UFVDC4_00174 [Staphylococcus phage vB_SauM-UFV_DC4]BDE75754.1 hypothetical protein [Staphylococcus phage S6]
MFEESKVPFSFIYKETKYFLHRRNIKNFPNGDSEFLLYGDENGKSFIIEESKLENLIEQHEVEVSYEEDII